MDEKIHVKTGGSLQKRVYVEYHDIIAGMKKKTLIREITITLSYNKNMVKL